MVGIITKQDALLQGLKFFYTGKECTHGHLSNRYCINGRCVECARGECRTYNTDNHTNIRRSQQLHYAANKEMYANRQRRYHESNPHKASMWTRKRRIQKQMSHPSWANDQQIERVYIKRVELNEQWGTEFEVDHIIPLINDTVCGLHVHNNLQLLDLHLNRSKSNTYQCDW